MSSSWPAPCPAIACAPSSARPSAPTPRRARSRCSSRRRTASRRAPITPARRGRCCRTSASSRSRPSQVREALERIGKLDDFELEPIVPAVEQWRYRNKLEYSFGTGAAGELVCGFHAPGRWDEIVPMDDCLLASERSNELREQVLAWARAPGPERLGPARAARPPAQPRDPRGPAHRRAAGAARHLAGPDRHRLADRGGALRRPVLDAAGPARREHGGRRDGAARRHARSCASSSAGSTS